MPELTIDEIKDDIARFLNRIFMERKVAQDLGFNVDQIDAFIETEGAKQMQKFDSMTPSDMIDLMLNEIKGFMSDDPMV